MVRDEHDAAFTVAKMMDSDMLLTVKEKVANALEDGTTLADFKKELIPALQDAGWWGKKDVTDPLTGLVTKAQLGSASRLETIFRSNIQSAYSVGHWESIQKNAKTAPFLMYDAVDDTRTRPDHAARDNQVHKVDSTFWKTHFPPNGWNCRCGVIQLDDDDLKEMNLTPQKSPNIKYEKWKNPRTGNVLQVPTDVDPGWDHNPGKARIESLAIAADDKAEAMLAGERAAYKKSLAVQRSLQARYAAQIKKQEAYDALNLPKVTAQKEINQALAENTKYLAPEIKKLQAKNPKANPVTLLAAAKDKALKSEQNSMVQTWKQAKKKGNEPSAKATAYVKTLPDEVQKSLEAEADTLSGAAAAKEAAELAAKQAAIAAQAAEDAALDALQEIAEGKAATQTKLKQKILAKIEADEIQYPSPQALLDDVEAKAAAAQVQAEQSSVLSGYKKKVLGGKIPTPKQQQIFNSLDDTTKAKVLADIDKKKAAQAPTPKTGSSPETGQPETLTLYHGGQATEDFTPLTFFTSQKKVAENYAKNGDDDNIGKITKVEVTIKNPANDQQVKDAAEKIMTIGDIEDAFGLDWEDMSGFEMLSPHLDADAATKVMKQLQKEGFDGAKFETDFDLAGNLIDDGSWAIFNTKQALKPGTKPKAAPAPPPKTVQPKVGAPDPATLQQIGGQGGSNKGGLFQDPETGVQWYLKQPKSEDAARNEVLAGKLYEAAGIEVPDLHLVQWEGKTSIASKIIDGLESDRALLTSGKDVPGVADGFMMDAWLGNWDVVGMGYDNLLIKSGRAIRVDTGGALRYRAQGGKKGDGWGSTVPEIESLTNGTASQTTAVFGKLTPEQMTASARKVGEFTDKDIDDLVAAHGPKAKKDADMLAATLKARRDYILKQFPDAKVKPKPLPLPIDTDRVTRLEQENVTNSRSNGFAIATDKDSIEDQQVLVYHKKNLEGETTSNAYMKVRGQSADTLAQELASAGANLTADYNDVHDKVVAAIKSIRYRINQGDTNMGSAISKVKEARDRFLAVEVAMEREVKAGLRPQKQLDDYRKKLLPIIENFTDTLTDNAPRWMTTTPDYKKFKIADAKAKEVEKGKRAWKKRKTEYQLSLFEKGHAREQQGTGSINSDVYELDVDGAKVRFWPSIDGVPQAMKGRLEIQVPGGGQPSAAKLFKIMDDLGIDSTRATDLDMELLYLRQIASANKIEKTAAFKKAMKDNDPLAARLAIDANLPGVSLDGNPHYLPMGEKQAFEQGRIVRHRPELLAHPEWGKFEADYRLHHSFTNGNMVESLKDIVNGGGHMAPTTDKIRRGIPLGGMSPTQDLNTGGANYFFTRLKTASGASSKTGIVWKAKVAARIDAITYDGDKYGKTTGNHVRNNRKVTIAEMKQAAGNGSNETIIKDSLSIFDDLESINANSKAQRDEIIKLFKAAGYDEWPDGRALTDVIKNVG
jgi:SPP1 gp7 family putative phage head morphogenesis protein